MFVKAEEIAIWIDRWLRIKEHTLLSFALTPGDTEIMHAMVGETKMFPEILLHIPWVRDKYQKPVDKLLDTHWHIQGDEYDYVAGWDLKTVEEKNGESRPDWSIVEFAENPFKP
jgi:hypothetical protein